MKTTTLPLKHSMNLSPVRLALLLIPLAIGSFALSPAARAACQEGCLTNQNTVLGDDALLNNTDGDNTAIGFEALYSTHRGLNTATGSQALYSNRDGYSNTATGFIALYYNIAGSHNTATGVDALYYNQGSDNTATGEGALFSNTSGKNNIALGSGAGTHLTTGENNIDIGNGGVAGESNRIRIGTQGTQTATYIAGIYGTGFGLKGMPVRVNSNGRLGTQSSSERFKEAIKPMDKASEAILALRPVTFRYKKEIDPDGTPQFGLVAEDVEKVNPDLVDRDKEGKPYSVRYEQVNAMLLNEFLKEHRKVEQLTKDFESKLAEQQKQIEALTVGLQKVSAQVEASKPAPQVVNNNQ
jgi:trimeric autotransporter adhesin